jgi:alpha-tubulin suppressor-like RCC1 family protein
VACVVDEEGGVYCWGDNAFGQLGHAGESSDTPLRVLLPEPVDEVVVGGMTACARSASSVYCWGRGDGDRLATGHSQPKAPPAKVALPAGVISGLALGTSDSDHALAIVDGLVYGWGFHAHGQLGISAQVGDFLEPTATAVLGDREPAAVRVFGWGGPIETSVSCALTEGNLECWGLGLDGELGNGASAGRDGSYSLEPAPVDGLSSGVTAVEIGSGFVLAIQDGKVYGWGNDYTGSGTGGAASPVPIAGLPAGRATHVEAGEESACAVIADGAAPGLYCWGYDPAALERAGLSGPNVFAPPLLVLDGAVSSVSLRSRGGCAAREGHVWCWGDLVGSALPVELAGFCSGSGCEPRVRELSLGRERGCALTEAGELYCFTGVGLPERLADGFDALRGGEYHFCATKSADRSLHCWGRNHAGQLGQGDREPRELPTAVPGIVPPVSVFDASGRASGVTCARDAEAFKCWGSNASRPLGNVPFVAPPTLLLPWP